MIKATLLSLTLLLTISSFATSPFNLSLAFSYPSDKDCSWECEEMKEFCQRHPLGKTLSPLNLAYFGKNIKTTSILPHNYQIKTVVIDAGHGGKDPGCKGAHSHEKHIVLAIAKKLGALIEVSYPEVRVIYTRTADVFVPLHERAAIANRNNADLFISIHCNAMSNTSRIYGSETYVMGLHTAEENLAVAKRENAAILLEEDYEKNYDFDPNSAEGHIMLSMFQNAFLEQSIVFAEKVEEQIAYHAKRKSRGVKQAGFIVLKETTMPSVLIESGFLTNASDESFLRRGQGQTLMAESIFNAFQSYKVEMERLSGLNYQTVPVATDYSQQKVIPYTPTPSPFTKEKPPQTSRQRVIASPTPQEGTYTAPASPSYQPVTSVESVTIYTTSPSNGSTQSSHILPKPPATNYQPTTGRSNDPFATSTNENHTTIHYCVQLAASTKPLNVRQGRWKNIDYLVQVIEEGRYMKYQIRSFKSLEEAKRVKQEISTKGFKDAFVVAYKNGEKVSLEALK